MEVELDLILLRIKETERLIDCIKQNVLALQKKHCLEEFGKHAYQVNSMDYRKFKSLFKTEPCKGSVI